MSKKIISIFLTLALALSMSVAASAAEAEEEATGAEVEAETSGTTGTFFFDSGDWNSSKIYFYIWDTTDPNHTLYASSSGWTDSNNWGSKKTAGTAVEGQDGVFESYEIDIPDDHDIFVIFYDPDTGAQTYNCVLNSSALGDTAYMTGNALENPEDSEKTAIEARFQNADCGPQLVITSSGNIVGEYITPGTNRARAVAQFVYTYIGQLEKLSGADIVTESSVANAISAYGTTADEVWAEFEAFNGQEGYDNYANVEADAKKIINPSSAQENTDSDSESSDSDDDSDNTSSKASSSSTSSTTSTKSTTTTTTKTASGSTTTTTTGSTDTAATGDTTGTVAFAVVLFVAAAAIVVTRKKVQE